MSQVKKLKAGEKIPKYAGGSIIIDGRKYEGEDGIRDFGIWTGTQNDTSGALSDIYRAILAGRNLVYTSGNNVVTGLEDGDISLDEHALKHLSKPNESRFSKQWQATFGHQEHDYRKGLSLLRGYNPASATADSNKKPSTDDLINVNGDYGWFTWDDDGKLTAGDPVNSLLLKRINQVYNYIDSDKEGRAKYKLNGFDNSVSALDAFKEDPRNNWANYKGELLAAINNNDLSDGQKKWLALLNIVDGEASSNNRNDRKKWEGKGFGNLYDKLKDVAFISDDGSLELLPDQYWPWDLKELTGKNVYFNDDFFASRYNSEGKFDPFRGFTLYNERLYPSGHPLISKVVTSPKGVNELLKSGDWSGADDIIMTRFTDTARKNPAFLPQNQYSEFLSNHPNYAFIDITGTHRVAGMNDTDQLIKYYNLDDETYDGSYRHYDPKYVVLDKNGKLRPEIKINGYDDLDEIPGGEDRESGLTAYPVVTGTGYQDYDNKYYEDLFTSKGKYTGFSVYRDKKNPNGNVVLHMPWINAEGLEGDEDLVLPPEVANMLLSNQSLWDNIGKSSQNKKNFVNILSRLIQSKARLGFDKWLKQHSVNMIGIATGNPLFTPIINAFIGANNPELKELKKLGFNDEEATELLKAILTAREGSREERRDDYLTPSPDWTPPQQQIQLNELGGKIANIRKFQGGGTEKGTTRSTGVSETRTKNKRDRDPRNAAGILEVGSANWTDDDTKDMLALGLDLTSLGLAFNPVTSIGSAAAGFGASTLRFAANRGRQTKKAGLQYGLDVLMDAASLIPGMKAVKTASTVRKVLPTLLKLASVAGLGTAFVNTVNKIANGEKFTTRDVSILVNGITAGVNIGKAGGFGRKTKKVTEFVGKEPTVGFKAGENGARPEGVVESLKLDRTKLSEVDSPEAFKKLVVDLAKAKGDNNVTLENVADRYDLSSFISNNGKSWSPSWNPKSWLKVNKKGLEKINDKAFNLKTKDKRVEFTPEEISKMSAFERWHRGLTGYNQMYNKTILGENPGSYTTVRKTVSVPDVVKVGSKQIRFSKAEQQSLQETPVMQQFNKFKELARAKSDSLTDSDLETAFRGLLKETPKRFDIVFDRDLTTKTTGEQPSWYRGRTEGLSRVTDQEGVTTTTRRRSYDTRMGVATPQLILPLKLSGYESEPPQNVQYAPYYGHRPRYKTGGKIIKAQAGTKVDSEVGGSYVGQLGRSVGGNVESPFKLPLDHINNGIRGGIQLWYSNRQWDAEQKRTPFIKSAYSRPGLRFTESGEANALDQSANRFVQNSPSPTSDYVRYNAMQQQNMAQAENLRQQADRVRSQEFSNYLKSLLEQNEKYSLLDKQNADENLYSIWNNKNAMLTAETAHLAQNAGIVNNMGYKFEDILNRDRKIKAQQDVFNDTIDAWNTYENAVKALDQSDPKYAEKVSQLAQLYQLARQRSSFAHPEILYKKGGEIKIKRNSSDPWISAHTKETQSYLRDLNKTVRDLLLKIKP